MKNILIKTFILILLTNKYLFSNDINLENGFHIPINIWNINSKDDDFAPYFLAESSMLIFNSVVNKYSKYFYSTLSYQTDSIIYFQKPIILNSNLNKNRKNNAYFCLIDNKSAFVNSNSMFKNGNFINIKKTNFERNAWTEPSIVPEFHSANFIGHPAISPNKNILIFSSNMHSNTNNTTDLWSATLQSDGSWDMLVSIDELNSNGNEITPYFVNDTTLIFASDGFEGKGGYDLYYANYVNGNWSKPIPLEDINTEYNETDPSIVLNYLIFASDRTGGKGGYDLYYAENKETYKEEAEVYKNNLSISATNYQLNITKIIEYNLISEAIKNDTNINISNDTSYILSPSVIEFKVHADFINNINYKLFCDNYILEENNINDSVFNVRFTPKFFLVDSCTLQIINNVDTFFIPLEIIKNEKKEPKLHNENNNTFYKILAKYSNSNDFEEINKDIIYNLKELLYSNKKVDIFANSNKIYSYIIDALNIKNINTNFIKTNNSNIIEFRIYKNIIKD